MAKRLHARVEFHCGLMRALFLRGCFGKLSVDIRFFGQVVGGLQFPVGIGFFGAGELVARGRQFTGANSGAPDTSARCTDAFATAIFSSAAGLLAHAANATTVAASAAAPLVNFSNFLRMAVLVLLVVGERPMFALAASS